MVELELLLDKIAEALILDELIDTTDVQNNQKFIRNGKLQTGQGEGVLALFQKDVEANVEDDLQSIADQITGEFTIAVNGGTDDTFSISIVGGGDANGLSITDLVFDEGEGNPLNVSQFIPLHQSSSIVDVERAEEFLDTNIYELLPTGDARQSRITRFFEELNALLPPESPNFDQDGNPGVDRIFWNGNWVGATQYSKDNSISYAQDNTDGNIDEEDAFIHRLKFGAVPANSSNSSKTIEDIYNTIKPYLTDILEEGISPQDDRLEYKNQSSGYLQFRNLNQGIIIRNTNKDFIEGLNPSNLTYLDTLATNGSVTTQGTGFTITMWVRFLDKVSEGTLFNFGNPLRTDNPFGFKLETYVLNKDDLNPHGTHATWGIGADYIAGFAASDPIDNYTPPFENSNTARFVRLVVNDNGILRDSHTGNRGGQKLTSGVIPIIGGNTTNEQRLLHTTFIPEDFQEWYFICASFNPTIDEDGSYGLSDYNTNTGALSHNTNFWMNNFNPDASGTFTTAVGVVGNLVANSNYGNRCKVEIISRTDLLRARGFKV